jgi:hypothetical protein
MDKAQATLKHLMSLSNAPLLPAEKRYLQAMKDDDYLSLDYCEGGGWWLGDDRASARIAWGLIRRSAISRNNDSAVHPGDIEIWRPNGLGLTILAGKRAEEALVSD